MKKYNPRIYNYKNLGDEDKKYFDLKMDIIEETESRKMEYDFDESTPVLEKLFCETAIEVLNELIDYLESDLIKFIIFAIDSDENDVDEQDTDEYFFGYTGEF